MTWWFSISIMTWTIFSYILSVYCATQIFWWTKFAFWIFFVCVYHSRICEICGSTAHNVVGVSETEPIEQWDESNNSTAPPAAPPPPSESRSFWQGHRFLKFLLACLVLAFVVSWLFHFNVPGWIRTGIWRKMRLKPSSLLLRVFRVCFEWRKYSSEKPQWLSPPESVIYLSSVWYGMKTKLNFATLLDALAFVESATSVQLA